jgi:protein kinase C substrate 80K-H
VPQPSCDVETVEASRLSLWTIDELTWPDVTAAKTKHSDGQSALRRLQNDISHDELELSKLTGYEYGREGEWKKLDGTCVDTIAGE